MTEKETDKARKEKNHDPDYSFKCEACEAVPVFPPTGMCGPCTFGEADTLDGNW